MIQPNELRIGNSLIHFDKVIEVTQILPLWIESNYSPFGYIEYEKLDPIPLTNEWLMKLGFQRALLPGMYYSPSSDYHIVVFKGFIFRGLGASVVEVKTVHHLQNLYHALVGIELTIGGHGA